MGQVDLNFRPKVPVFDANIALGRRHDKRVSVDTVEGLLEAMDGAGVNRALVYTPHAVTYDPHDGNSILINEINGEPRLEPQFICSPTFNRLNAFADEVSESNVRSVRMVPGFHNYPFRDWVVDPWLQWMAEAKIPLWIHNEWQTQLKRATPYLIDPRDIYETLKANPGVTAVLSEIHYEQFSWVLSLLRSLPNICIEISRFGVGGGIEYLLEAVGERRILFGSRFPDQDINLQLYSLHQSGLSEQTLKAICADNLNSLLAGEQP